MIQIAICDDVVEETVTLQKYIHKYCREQKVKYRLSLYSTGEQLLSEIKKIDILFLDIKMPGLDGIETGELIREQNSHCRIIMATCMVERMKEAFFIEAFRFVVKPFQWSEIEEALEACMKKILGSESILLYFNRNLYRVRQIEIQYIVTYDSYCEYRVRDKMMRSEESLRDLECKLDERLFFRIHRKYIINMAQIQSYRNGRIEMQDIVIPVSRRRKKEFEQAYMEFDLKYR